MARVILTLLDSFGIGYAHDAEAFGDRGADTLGHIAAWMADNRKGADGKPRYLYLPHLAALGLEKPMPCRRERPWPTPCPACRCRRIPWMGGGCGAPIRAPRRSATARIR